MRTLVFAFLLTSLCFLSFHGAAAQETSPAVSATEKEKLRKELEKRVLEIIDQTVGEAATLKLAHNRAIVYAVAGDLYWKFDEKRARELFRSAGAEITLALAEAEKEKKEEDDPFVAVFESNNVRGEVLPLVAKHDADLALELLVETRPARLAEALLKAAAPNNKQDGGYFNYNPEQFRAQQEIALEQRFALLAAEQNPDKAIKLIKDSLAKGISWNVMPLLQKINQKDEKKAAALADDVVRRIVDTDLAKKREDMNAAIGFLQYAVKPPAARSPNQKIFKFSEAQTRDIADKLAATFLQPTNALDVVMAMNRVMADLEKILPQKSALLKQRQAETMKTLPPEFKRLQQQQRIWNQNSTPEEILAELPKYNDFEKAGAYQSLVSKIVEIDDEARAKKLIEQIPDEKTRERAADAYESAKINRAADDGKLDEAKKLIKNLSQKKNQIQKLVALAVQFHRKNTEKDRESAAALIKEAKALTSEFPEDEDELNDLMEIVRGYAVIEPKEAFRLFEPIVEQLNDFVQASAILSKYNRRSQSFKKGELIMRTNGSPRDGVLLFRYINHMQLLGKADLHRMSAFSDKFQRSDARSIVRLFVAQGFLSEEKKVADAGNFVGEVYYLEY